MLKFFGRFKLDGSIIGRFRMDGSMWDAVHMRNGTLCLVDYKMYTVWMVRSYKKDLEDWTPLTIMVGVTLKKAFHIAEAALQSTGLVVYGGKYDLQEVG